MKKHFEGNARQINFKKQKKIINIPKIEASPNHQPKLDKCIYYHIFNYLSQ